MKYGKLFLIPTYLSSDNDVSFISPIVTETIKKTTHYLVENIRTTRRFISSLKTGISIEALDFQILDKKSNWAQMNDFFKPVRQGMNLAVLSEAGVPCLADPGNMAVSFAYQNNIQVVPIPGASSIQMALIASGFNGQQFTFHGYLPIQTPLRQQKIRDLEKLSQTGYTQLFMEAPFRNQQLIKDILKTCRPNTLLSIAKDICGKEEKIWTQPISLWQKTDIQLHKIPTIFSFGQFI